MNVEVLLSCMNAESFSIAEETNIKGSAIIINQTSYNDISIKGNIKMLSTVERGLSKSRNYAIENASNDICLICDDDEWLYNDYMQIISEAYNKYDADIIIFDLENYHKKIRRKPHFLNFFEILKISSVQMTFKRESIQGHCWFDINLGAGSGNGAGEDTKFLLDARKKKKKIFYVPVDIGVLKDKDKNSSSWFHGYTKNYFFNMGKVMRYQFGISLGLIFCLRFLLLKNKIYKKETGILDAFKSTFKGFIRKDINSKYE